MLHAKFQDHIGLVLLEEAFKSFYYISILIYHFVYVT